MFTVKRKVRIVRALAKIFPLRDPHVLHPIPGIATSQTALAVPASLYAMLHILPEMVLIVNALLILIQPPFKTVPLTVFQKTGLSQINPSVAPVVLDTPEIKTRAMLHRVGAYKLSVI